VRRGGCWLAGAGITATLGYFTTTTAAGGRHTDLPYALLGLVIVVGLALYGMGSRDNQGNTARALSELGTRLRTMSDTRGLTAEDVSARTGTWSPVDVGRYLAGTVLPDWEFVKAFVQIVAGKTRAHRLLLERELRPLWEAAGGGKQKSQSAATPASVQPWRIVMHRRSLIVAAVLACSVGVLAGLLLPAAPTHPAVSAAAICSSVPQGIRAQRIYCDDLNSDRNDWYDPNTQSEGQYSPGMYELTAAAGGDTQVGAPQKAQLGLDTSLNVLITVMATANQVPGGQFGLACRGGPDKALHLNGKGYAFVLQGTTARIEKVEFTDVTNVWPLASSQVQVVHSGQIVLQASCATVEGTSVRPGQPGPAEVVLSFWVNGKRAATYTDRAEPFTSGYVGVFCHTAASSPRAIKATFERFGVYEL
jgi:hypothetical protein